MPASRTQASDLRRGIESIIRWAKQPASRAGKIDREKVLLDALEAAFAALEREPSSLEAWILGAMHASLQKRSTDDGRSHMWIVRDRRLFDEACDTIEFLHQQRALAQGRK